MLREIQIDEHRVRHYSDIGMMIRQTETGVLYEDAVDNVPCKYIYEETDEPIPADTTEAETDDYEAALNRLGVTT